MRCTFYPEVLEPWSEEWSTPPAVGRALRRHGTTWIITKIVLQEWPGISNREASVWLAIHPTGENGAA